MHSSAYKVHQNAFGDRDKPDPVGSLGRSQTPQLNIIKGLLLRKEWEGEGRKEGERDREWDGSMGGDFFQSQILNLRFS